MKTTCIPVFAYGTLQKGHHNAARVIESGEHEFVGSGLTVDHMLMRNAGIAFVSRLDMHPARERPKVEKFAGRIAGDLWLVDADGLKRCDALEGHPDNYHRECVPVEVGGKRHWAWLYFYAHFDRYVQRYEKPDKDGVVRWSSGSRWSVDQ